MTLKELKGYFKGEDLFVPFPMGSKHVFKLSTMSLYGHLDSNDWLKVKDFNFVYILPSGSSESNECTSSLGSNVSFRVQINPYKQRML